jgi:hypothetical protein
MVVYRDGHNSPALAVGRQPKGATPLGQGPHYSGYSSSYLERLEGNGGQTIALGEVIVLISAVPIRRSAAWAGDKGGTPSLPGRPNLLEVAMHKDDEYQIVEGHDTTGLVTNVNLQIQLGWEAQGGPLVIGDRLYQAMVR